MRAVTVAQMAGQAFEDRLGDQYPAWDDFDGSRRMRVRLVAIRHGYSVDNTTGMVRRLKSSHTIPGHR